MSASDFGILPGRAEPFFTKVDNTPLYTYQSPNPVLTDSEMLTFLRRVCVELVRKGIIQMSAELLPEGIRLEAYTND